MVEFCLFVFAHVIICNVVPAGEVVDNELFVDPATPGPAAAAQQDATGQSVVFALCILVTGC